MNDRLTCRLLIKFLMTIMIIAILMLATTVQGASFVVIGNDQECDTELHSIDIDRSVN